MFSQGFYDQYLMNTIPVSLNTHKENDLHPCAREEDLALGLAHGRMVADCDENFKQHAEVLHELLLFPG
jgi:hypothetical protein